MATPNNYPYSSKASDTSSTSSREKDRSQIHRILHEVGLNPTDYTFSPTPGDQSPPAFIQNRSSAFAAYSPPSSPQHYSGQLTHHSRSATYVQQPAPQGPPSGGALSQFAASFSPQSSQSGQNQPPPPPPAPPSASGPFGSSFSSQSSQSGQNQPPASAPGPFASSFGSQPPQPQSGQNQPPPPQAPPGPFTSLFSSQPPQSGQNQPPPPQAPSGPFTSLFSSQPPQSGQNQPPPPSTTQAPPGSFASLFGSQPAPPGQNQSPQDQQASNMNHHSFSPRRTPPPPPSQFGSYPCDSRLSAEHYLREINSQEVPPVKVVKPSTQNLVYRKEIRIRYLQPPTPPPPAPIVIREKHAPPIPPQSPLLIRERKPEARTPPPLTIRERPPTPPAPLEPYVIEKNIPAPPPQPRQIIIERLPTPPPKPRTVIFEKWLPYKKVKRPVLLQKAPPLEPVKPTRNVVIEYEPLKAFTVRRVIEEGVFRVDPREYTCYNNQPNPCDGDVRVVERIEDLPPPSDQLMRVLDDYSQPVAASTSSRSFHHESEHLPSSIQQLLADARPVSNADHLTSISRNSNTPAYRSERVLSTGYNSSNPSPTIVPLERSRSKHSYRHSRPYSSRDSPASSHVDDIY